ncbi:hypothetical protein [Nitrospirillum iridis]|uniref:SH3 domain-containing protein n=1 Tax=Nitrospirillum iridis TaxID=765888 RepID=A0A7X0AZ96_9PROT|nr:hypothetical protein [Nitrospirillum iridis]MBB6252497.1 hypothetical protein [Nitrospirillum iridis]
MKTDSDQANRDHVAKFIRLLGSNFEGEAVTALAKLRRLLPQRGLGFNDVGQWIQSPARVIYRPVAAPPPPDARLMEDRIIALERQRAEALRALRTAQARADKAEDQAGQLVSELVAVQHQARATAVPPPPPGVRAAPRGRRQGYAQAALLAVAGTIAVGAAVGAATGVFPPAASPTGQARPHATVTGRSAFLYPAPTNEQAALTLLPPTTDLEVLSDDTPTGWVKVRVHTGQGLTVGFIERRRLDQAPGGGARRIPG